MIGDEQLYKRKAKVWVDGWRNKSCAQEKEGGWWFHACYAAHPNGVYPAKPKSSSSTIRWWKDRENVFVLTAVEMKVRRCRNSKEEITPEIPTKEEDLREAEEKDYSLDYDFTWSTDEEISFADPDSGGVEQEYNTTWHNGHSDINPWWILNTLGFD
ncbi:uncharacterized protein [Palaemon carinicauda]|uniref:uncharacterized protein n=1 Tax=Palaemon carinicauda TaxID=392227 RepID=UPI0035B58120